MQLKIYAIYDSKTEAHATPFFMQAHGQAIRAFTDVVNDPSTNINRHPADFTLFCLGEWDDNSGKFSPLDAKVNLGCALDFLKTPEGTTFIKPQVLNGRDATKGLE